ncbi:OmpW family protein [Rhodoferax sp.]|uniref:OmpW/AlkL family protein n=1 Tax=Rhodoferax sp. TaxID=50421 RepID=UPI00374D3007
MKKSLLASAICLLVATCAVAQSATESPWLVRARAVHLDSSNGDSTALALSINNKWLPEVDISYFFTPQIATELVLTVPQKQTLSAGGTPIGSFKHLPPTLTLQYHFDALGVKPYLGAGLNYTRISAVNLPAGVSVDRNSFGPALQAGVDIPLNKNLSLNLDLKKVYIRTDVAANGARIGTFKIDPVLLGIGLGWRF